MKNYIVYWFTSLPGIEFARDVNGKIQLYTKEEAKEIAKDSNLHIDELGI